MIQNKKESYWLMLLRSHMSESKMSEKWNMSRSWYIRVVTGRANRPIRSDPVKDSLPVGLIFFEFFHLFFKKMTIKVSFSINPALLLRLKTISICEHSSKHSLKSTFIVVCSKFRVYVSNSLFWSNKSSK